LFFDKESHGPLKTYNITQRDDIQIRIIIFYGNRQMRAYHYLKEKFALQAICNRKVKIARIAELNDPFELLCFDMFDPNLRKQFEDSKNAINPVLGLLCCSKSRHEPLLWSHYADKHRGICLGFDLDEATCFPVTYLPRRQVYDKKQLLELKAAGKFVDLLWFTKYRNWYYEKEIRRVEKLDPETRVDGHYFVNFGPDLVFKEILIGAFCPKSIQEIRDLAGDNRLRIVKVRRALKTYRMVENPLLSKSAKRNAKS